MVDLRRGVSFSNAARKWSEDAFSRDRGGSLGCIPADTFGNDIRKKISGLKPDENSGIVRSIWGYHVIRREPFDDTDAIAVLRQEFMDTQREKIMKSIKSRAVVEYQEN